MICPANDMSRYVRLLKKITDMRERNYVIVGFDFCVWFFPNIFCILLSDSE